MSLLLGGADGETTGGKGGRFAVWVDGSLPVRVFFLLVWCLDVVSCCFQNPRHVYVVGLVAFHPGSTRQRRESFYSTE